MTLGLVKLAFIGAALFLVSSAVPGIDIHNIFFDYAVFILISSIVAGAPEPDMLKQLTFKEFLYLWYYRSSHLLVASATAYFIHKDKWKDIASDVSNAAENEPK